jgi:hypothetical protein
LGGTVGSGAVLWNDGSFGVGGEGTGEGAGKGNGGDVPMKAIR